MKALVAALSVAVIVGCSLLALAMPVKAQEPPCLSPPQAGLAAQFLLQVLGLPSAGRTADGPDGGRVMEIALPTANVVIVMMFGPDGCFATGGSYPLGAPPDALPSPERPTGIPA